MGPKQKLALITVALFCLRSNIMLITEFPANQHGTNTGGGQAAWTLAIIQCMSRTQTIRCCAENVSTLIATRIAIIIEWLN